MSQTASSESQFARPESSAEQRRIPITIAYYMAFIVLGLVVAVLGPTLPGLAQHTQTQLNQISFLFAAHSLGYLVGSMRNGRMYDRVPGHPVMAGSLLVMAMMIVLIPLIPLLWLLTAALLVLGIAEGTLDVGGNTLLVWIHGRKVGPFMNGLHFFFGVGAFLSPIIVAQAVLLSGDINWAYWFFILLIIPVAFWLLHLPSPPLQSAAGDGQTGKTDHLLVAMIAIFFFLHVGAESSFGGWIYTYTLRQWGDLLGPGGGTTAAYLTSAFWGSFTIGRLLGIPIAARFRPGAILLTDLVISLAGVGIILLLSNSYLALWIGTIITGLAIASLYATTLSFAERRMAISGRVTGWFFVGSGAGGIFLPWLIGQLFETVGPNATMLAILADLVLAIGVFAVLMLVSRRTRVTQ